MIWGEAALQWLPTATVSALALVAVVALVRQPSRPGRTYWLVALVIGGAVAIVATAWREGASEVALGAAAARLDALGRLLHSTPGTTPDETVARAAAAIVAQDAKIKDLEGQVRALAEKTRVRTIDPAIAADMAEYLRGFGSHRVVLSCVPDDVEAYSYANQIANVLRTAGWEALGPETTTIFGEAPAMGITLYVHDGAAPPDAARLLIDAFTRFNIPYQSGVAPSDAIPDPETVELFVGRKP
ncbi:MAG TPA: hypothetical protein VGS13_10120 [Stellaceae bacterium]|nr:hypothetical protein [Stellaceae bacterium]